MAGRRPKKQRERELANKNMDERVPTACGMILLEKLLLAYVFDMGWPEGGRKKESETQASKRTRFCRKRRPRLTFHRDERTVAAERQKGTRRLATERDSVRKRSPRLTFQRDARATAAEKRK